jgi:hypothetical protein
MWHSVQGEADDVKTVTVAGHHKMYDVTEEQLEGLMRSAPASVSMEHDSLFCSTEENVRIMVGENLEIHIDSA